MELRINYSIPITFTVVVERDELPDEHEHPGINHQR